jgi:hypothetical protein
VNTFYADVYISTKPATTTPPTRREHTATVLPFPPPWSLSCDAPTASRRATMFTMPVCWPSRRRTAALRRIGAPGPLMPLCLPSPCDE